MISFWLDSFLPEISHPIQGLPSCTYLVTELSLHVSNDQAIDRDLLQNLSTDFYLQDTLSVIITKISDYGTDDPRTRILHYVRYGVISALKNEHEPSLLGILL